MEKDEELEDSKTCPGCSTPYRPNGKRKEELEDSKTCPDFEYKNR